MKREDLVALAQRLGVPASRIQAFSGSREVVIPCPLAHWKHQKKLDRRPSMSLRVVDHGPSPWQCFACKSAGRSILPLVEEVQAYDSSKTYTKLMAWAILKDQEDFGAAIDGMEDFDGEEVEVEPPPDFYPMTLINSGDFKRVLHRTARRRGVTVESAKRWFLRYDERRDRVIIPLMDRGENLVGVSGRRCDESRQPKYLNYTWVRYGEDWRCYGAVPEHNPPDQIVRFPKSTHLLGQQFVEPGDIGVLVEGQFDTILLDQLLLERGIENVRPLGYQGNSLSDTQADVVCDLVSEVIDFSDNDDPGRAAIKKATRLLGGRASYTPVKWFPGLEGYDPGRLVGEHPNAVIDMLVRALALTV